MSTVPGTWHSGDTSTVDAARWLTIEPDEFREKFGRTPFFIGHQLARHPLFALPRLMQLANTLPAQNVEYNAGELPISLSPALTPRNGLTVEETIRRIAECKSWLVLKYVEHDPAYRDLLEGCLEEIRPHSEPLYPGMMHPEGFIFITSPRSVTPYHMDPEHNFLLQIRGSKQIHQFDGHDPSIVSQEELEQFSLGAHRNLVFKEEYRRKEWVFELTPDGGLHFPVAFPHYVVNGPEVSVSFSVTFRTPDLEKHSLVHCVNAYLRSRGWKPTPVGQSPVKDTVKYQAARVLRRVRGLFRSATP